MKKISLFIFTIFISFLLVNTTYAASANISVSANKSTVMVGETVTVTVKIYSSSKLGSWNFDVTNSSNLSLVSSSFGGTYIKDVVDSATQKSKTYTFTYKAKSSGTGSINIKNSLVYGYDENKMSVSSGSKSFNMMTYSQLQDTYSKNNYLSSLKVDGVELNPIFDKDTLEYNIELENGTENINISASKEDSRSSISGVGEISVSEGINALKVVVTAQSGSTRTYTINATVKELSPIIVDINGVKNTVIRKKEFMPTVSMYYDETVIKINEEEVPAYYNTVTNFTLVGLKDSAGNSNLYIYDGNYTLYEELTFNQMSIYLLEMDNTLLPNGYEINEINIGDKKVVAYKKIGYEFPIVYGMNIETGEKQLYKYDGVENTLQRYEEIKIDNNEDLYFYIIIGLFGLLVISYIVFISLLIKKNTKQKDKLEKTMRLNINDIKDVKIKEEDLEKDNKKLKKDQIKKEKELKKINKKENKKKKINKDDDEKMAEL